MGNNPSSLQEYTPEQWRQYNEHMKMLEAQQRKQIPKTSIINKLPNIDNRTQIKTINKNLDMKPTMSHKTQMPSIENNFQNHYTQRMMDNLHIGVKTPVSGATHIRPDSIQISELDKFNDNPFKKKQMMDFLNEQQQAKQRFESEQEQRRRQFYDELNEVSNLKYNPLQVLGLDQNINHSERDIKLAYKKLATRYHPDKGGNPEMFKVLTKAYLFLIKKTSEDNYEEKGHDSLKSHYSTEDTSYTPNEKDFDVGYFNKLFSENKLENIDDDSGYGDWLKQDDISKKKTGNIFNEKFNLDVFNKVFDELDEDEHVDSQIDIYKEPEVLPSTTMDYTEVDYKKSAEYTKNNVLNSKVGIQYTDLKSAHTNTKLINPNKVNIKQYKDVEEYSKVRDTQDFTVTEKDRQIMERQRQMLEDQERERQARVKSRDIQLEQHSNRVSKLMLDTKHSKTLEYKPVNLAPINI
jgi:curved DNA-binding protein CbpA